MKRIYRNCSYGKELIGYEYKGLYIEIEDTLGARNIMYGATRRWYNVTLPSGEKYCSDILREIKEKIDKEIAKK